MLSYRPSVKRPLTGEEGGVSVIQSVQRIDGDVKAPDVFRGQGHQRHVVHERVV